jgi:hypothetical protein
MKTHPTLMMTKRRSPGRNKTMEDYQRMRAAL